MKTACITAALALFGCATSAPQPAPQDPSTTAKKPPTLAPSKTEAEPAPPPVADTQVQPETPKVALTRDIPTECAEAGCLPPETFAKSLCKGKYPALAIHMFEKSTPWTRKWVNMRSLEAVNAYGGSNSGGELVFAEEVLLLRRQSAASGGIQVSGGEDVDVLRWNGTCVTVRESELVEYVPGLPQHARIIWNYLDEGIQEALLTNKTVQATRKRHRQECRGASKTSPTGACKKADSALTGAIVVAVRKGISLPPPEKRPEWADPGRGQSLAQAARD